MKKLLVVLCAFFTTGALADGVARPMDDSQDPYETILELDMRIPLGMAGWELDWEQEESATISIWFSRHMRCQGFGVSAMKAVTADDEIVEIEANPYGNIYHYAIPANASKITFQTQNDRILPQLCHVHVKKSNTEIPDLLSVLAKVGGMCTTNDDGQSVCNYWLIQLDSDDRTQMNLSEEDFRLFGMEMGKIYRMKGHMLVDAASGVEYFAPIRVITVPE